MTYNYDESDNECKYAIEMYIRCAGYSQRNHCDNTSIQYTSTKLK